MLILGSNNANFILTISEKVSEIEVALATKLSGGLLRVIVIVNLSLSKLLSAKMSS